LSYEGLVVFLAEKLKKSNKFFLDVELINLYSVLNKKIKSIPVKFSYSEISSINVFDLKNFVIIFEALKIIVYLKFSKL